MPVMNFGEKMDKVYLEVFKPESGKSQRIAILDTSKVIAVEAHYVPDKDIQGMYTCCHGVCCSALGFPSQYYLFPVWVFEVEGKKKGSLQILRLTPKKYEQLVSMVANGIDLNKQEIQVNGERKGTYTDYTFYPLPNALLTPADRETIRSKVLDKFYAVAETSVARPCTPTDWNEMLNGGEYSQPAKIGASNPPQHRLESRPASVVGGNQPIVDHYLDTDSDDSDLGFGTEESFAGDAVVDNGASAEELNALIDELGD